MPVSWSRTERPRVPVILLTGAALTLLGDIFGPLPSLAASHRIRRRVVSWGQSEPVEADHPAVVVSEQFLSDAISENLQVPRLGLAGDWTIYTAPPLPRECSEHSFGVRRATTCRVKLREAADSDACWIESTPDGWLFLIPTNRESGYLLAVGGSAEQLLSRSRLLAGRLRDLTPMLGSFATHPRVNWPLTGGEWIACGSAVLGFDPLCGDGTAQAVREAILAAAVMRSVAGGAEAAPLLQHYEARLTAGMARHLALCADFYRTGGSSEWWRTAVRSIQEGTQWCAARLEGNAGLQYRMEGFELRPVA